MTKLAPRHRPKPADGQRLEQRRRPKAPSKEATPSDPASAAWPRYLAGSGTRAQQDQLLEHSLGASLKPGKPQAKDALPAAPAAPVPGAGSHSLVNKLTNPASKAKSEGKPDQKSTDKKDAKDSKKESKKDGKKDGKKDADKESKDGAGQEGAGQGKDGKKAKAGGGGQGGGGDSGGGGGDLATADAVAGLEIIEADPEIPSEPTRLDVAPDVEVPVIAPDWQANSQLPDDAITLPRSAPPAPASKGGKEAKDSKDGKGGPDQHATAAAPANDPAAMASARDAARSAYASLAGKAQGEQARFVSSASAVSAYMAHCYGVSSSDINHGHESGIVELDARADRACNEIETLTSRAEMALDSGYNMALTDLQNAANNAWGAINANDGAASAMIASHVSALEGGHTKRLAGETGKVSKALEQAVKALQSWSDTRTDVYPLAAESPQQGAKNEAIQGKVPKLATDKIGAIQKQVEAMTKGWTTTSTNTLCSVSCSYRSGLDSNRKSTFDGGRQSVASALKQALKSLAEQQRETRRTLRQLRVGALSQARNQQRSARSRLTSQARASLTGLRRGAQGAIGAVDSASRNALPGYWRNLTGLEQNLRAAAPGGAAALRRLVQTAPDTLEHSLQNTSASLHERLQANRDRLDSEQTKQRSDLAQNRSLQIEAVGTTLGLAVAGMGKQLDQRIDGFTLSSQALVLSVSNAAQSCMQAPEQLFKESLAKSGEQASSSLDGVFTGAAPGKKGEGDGAKGGDGKAGAEGDGKSACTGCAKDDAGGGGKGDGAGAGGDAGPKGITNQADALVKELVACNDPASLFQPQIEGISSKVATELTKHGRSVEGAMGAGFLGSAKAEAVTAALRGITKGMGNALDKKDYPAAINTGTTLTAELADKLGADSKDYKAAIKYLAGDVIGGAKAELDASQNWYNDQESRIEATMRSLTKEQAVELASSDPALKDRIHDALDGTDQKVFDALAAGDAAKADALRMKDKIDEARRDGNNDALHAAEVEFTTLRDSDGNGRALADMSEADRKKAEDAHRLAVAKALGQMVSDADLGKTGDAAGTAKMSDEERAAAYITRDIKYYVSSGEGPPQEVTQSVTGANKDLAVAILLHGNDSVEAQAARLGVELQRTDDPPKALNVDSAVFDERFAPDKPNASAEEKAENAKRREEARAKRAQILLLAAEKYAGNDAAPKNYQADATKPLTQDSKVAGAQDALAKKFAERFGEDKLGAELVEGLLKDERPSPQTAALAMRHAMYSHLGTNEELLFRFTERMSRSEINDMRDAFQEMEHKNLDAELGLHGKGAFFSELSGDDRLRMERAMLGVPSNEREKAEAAVFALQQQKRETGWLGKTLAAGSDAEKAMNATEQALYKSIGVDAKDFSTEGLLEPGKGKFDDKGNYTGQGKDKETFAATTATAQQATQNYTAAIDSYADIGTTGLAIAGAIAAAVITVATGGAAGPLIAAAVVAGLASMATNYAIKGGRYGWEQAAVDLGMTAVQAITAGVGAQLGAAAQVASKGAQAASQASRMIASLARIFTGNPVVDQIIVGAITSSISTLGSTAFQEDTWEHGADHAVGALFSGLLKGALTGAATAGISQALEVGAGLGPKLQNLVASGFTGKAVGAMALRGLGRGFIAGMGAMAGRGTEILYDKASGKFHGNAEEAFGDIGKAGLHAALQGMGEGAGEAVGQHFHNKTQAKLQSEIAAEREQLGLEKLSAKALEEAAGELHLLNQVGKNRDGLGRALNLEHVARHGGIKVTRAIPHPDPLVLDSMRGELLRHLPPEMHGQFNEVPIRVLSESEYHKLTRSESGPVVTLIQDGKPTVVIREGTPLSRLADEGPHLAQTRDAHTKQKVSRLDESVLAHWDSLDLDSQLSLYQNKIELEIDAHQRIAASLEAELVKAKEGAGAIRAEIERNADTLHNLRQRQEEVANLGPAQRSAIESGTKERPQFLEQAARLFSKEQKAATKVAPVEDAAVAKAKPAEEGKAPRPGYDEQPELRGPRLQGEPDSREALRQRHEDWVEGLRKGYLDAGSMPPMAEGVPKPGRPPWHGSIEEAYAAYNALVEKHGGTREAGIVRNADTGEYMVVLGSPVDLRVPNEAFRQETVLHFHPDYGPTLYRGPSGTDLDHTASIARQTMRPSPEFIEDNVPGKGRGRTAFTRTPVADASVPGGIRMRIDIEYVEPATGRYVHQEFESRQQWAEHYNERTTWLDPDGPVYRNVMRAMKADESRMAGVAASHRPEGVAAPAPVEPAQTRGRPTHAILESEAPTTRREQVEGFDKEILGVRLSEIGAKRRMAQGRGLVDEEFQHLPDAVTSFLKRGEHLSGRSEVPHEIKSWARRVARERFGALLQEALLDMGKHTTMTQAAVEHLSEPQLDYVRRHGELPQGVEFHHLLPVADFPEFAHLAEVGVALPTEVHKAAGHGYDATRPVEAGTFVDPHAEAIPVGPHNDPEARKYYRPKNKEVADGSRSRGNVDKDLVIDFKVRVQAAEQELRRATDLAARFPKAKNQARLLEAQQALDVARQQFETVKSRIESHAAMREQLLRHVPPEMHEQFGAVPIRVLSEAEYHALTRSESGPVVTLIVDGQAVVVVREGTSPARLAQEGPHLMQTDDLATLNQVAKLDEAHLAQWDSLSLDAQLDLYHTKIGLEIDAHQRIQESLLAEQASGKGDHGQLAEELARNADTLRNLHQRNQEVRNLSPQERAAIAAGQQARPQYLDQPPRLFSKDAPLAQRFHQELADFPHLQLELLAASQIGEPGRRSRAMAEVHARLVSLRHLANLASGSALHQGSDFSLLQLRAVAASHQLDQVTVARHVQEILATGRHPEGVAADSAYGRHLLALAESLAGPRASLKPLLELPSHGPQAPAPTQSTPEPEAPKVLTEAEIRHAEKARKARESLPKHLSDWGLADHPAFAKIFEPEQELVLIKVNTALANDSITKAGPEAKRAALAWALAMAEGSASQFANFYEYAQAVYNSTKNEVNKSLVGVKDKTMLAEGRQKILDSISHEGLSKSLEADLKRINAIRGTTPSSLDPLPAQPLEIGQLVQALEHLRFGSDAAEAYHARKHAKELPPEFVKGDVIGDHAAALADTVRSGSIEVARLTHTGSTLIIIRKTYGDASGSVMEAIIYVTPEGRVIIASYGKAKAKE